jgi:hypothetical protein
MRVLLRSAEAGSMRLSKYLFFLLYLTALNVKAQPALFDTKKLDYNYTVLLDTVYKTLENNGKPDSGSFRFIYYPDSVPGHSLLIPKKKHTTYSDPSKGKHYDSLLWLNPWVKDFPLSKYRVLSIFNLSKAEQKIFHYSTGYNPTGDYSEFYLDKIAVFLEAKDEKGNWKEIKDADKAKIRKVISRRFVRPDEQIVLLVKAPEGNYKTDLRFKLVINAQPDSHTEKYIYSNTFKGRIDKTLLEK